MGIKNIALFLSLLALCACGAGKAPLQPVLESKITTLELAKIEVQKLLIIQQVNPIAFMGSSGMALGAALLAQRADAYEKRAGPVHQLSIDMFEKTLLDALSKQGIQTNSVKKNYWDYFNRPGKKKKHTDAILRIELQQMGFWSRGLVFPYVPSILVTATMVDPASRKVLYSDRFAMGIDLTSLKMMELKYGKINILPGAQKLPTYNNFKAILKQPEHSRKALLKLVRAAAHNVAKSLRGDKQGITDAYAKTSALMQTATTDNLIVIVNHANIRSKPTIHSKILHRLKKGDIVRKMRKQADWFYIRLQNSHYAWAHQSVFLDRHAISTHAVPTISKNSLVIGVNIANIRSAPKTSSKILGKLKKGDVVSRLRKQGNWFYIRLPDGRQAWAHQSVF